jgi:general nucleoside transport system permease protein
MSRNRFLFIIGTIVGLIVLTVVLGRNDVPPATVAASMLATTLRFATPITLGALAGLFCERSGVVNIAIEGMMLAAAFGAWIVAALTQNLLLGVMAGILTGMLMGLLHAWLSVTFKVDQIVSGTVINILAVGLTGFLDTQVLTKMRANGLASAGLLPQLPIPILAELPVIGPIFRQQPIAWIAIILVVVSHYVMFSTRWGLRTRAVGENPRAADTVGINVRQMRYANVLIGAGIAGLGGAYFTLRDIDHQRSRLYRSGGADLRRLDRLRRVGCGAAVWGGECLADQRAAVRHPDPLTVYWYVPVSADDYYAGRCDRARGAAGSGWCPV